MVRTSFKSLSVADRSAIALTKWRELSAGAIAPGSRKY
jgi:hypothetical protein